MKALVLSSGGVDSTTALAMAVSSYGNKNVTALSISYGQKHDRELKAAREVADYYGVERLELDLSKVFLFSGSSLLKGSGAEIPDESYEQQLAGSENGLVSTYVPFRNGLFLAVAASIAQSRGCGKLFYGAHSDDHTRSAYPDCSPAFNSSMREAVWQGTGNEVYIEAPFINSTKAEVVRQGLRLEVPYELTWSCYEGGGKPCGRCATCLDRAAAFEANGVEDPAARRYEA